MFQSFLYMNSRYVRALSILQPLWTFSNNNSTFFVSFVFCLCSGVNKQTYLLTWHDAAHTIPSDASENSSKHNKFFERKYHKNIKTIKPDFLSKFPTEASMNRDEIGLKTFIFICFCLFWRLPFFNLFLISLSIECRPFFEITSFPNLFSEICVVHIEF